jgi:SAM-dependent methyltransferase
MRQVLRGLVRHPVTGEELELVAFDEMRSNDGATDVREGILFDAAKRSAFPIMNGVPMVLEKQFTREFLQRHGSSIRSDPRLSGLELKAGGEQDWSFSREWNEHFDTGNERTCGYTACERLEQFFMETQTDAEDLRGQTVLDAGCGNGALSSEIAALGAAVVGIDYSSSVLNAERRRGSDRVHFIRGDLQSPPLVAESFDLAISIGVLHHTPDTFVSFKHVARLVKPGGKFYVWLYRLPEGFIGRHVKVPIYDFLRFMVSRFPVKLQDISVSVYARLVRASHNVRHHDNPVHLREYLVSAYDDLTPMWRHYHTPLEVSRWFYECGFNAPAVTHWDNPYGFGLVAVKEQQKSTPGIHYGEGVKLWDDSRTLLGKLHSE